MRILCIETTLAKCSVCLSCDGRQELVVAHEDFAHSEKLFVLIEKLMNKHGLSYDELNFIACTVGPGSFGGIRVGVSAVNALKILVPKVMALGFNTLEVIANAGLPLIGSAMVAISHGNKYYITEVDAQGRLLESARAVGKDALAGMLSKDVALITTKDCAALLPFTSIKILDLDATAVMYFAQKIIHESRTNLYNQVSPIYVSEPSITVAK